MTNRISTQSSLQLENESKEDEKNITVGMSLSDFLSTISDQDRLEVLKMLLDNKFLKEDCVGDLTIVLLLI